MLIDNKFSFLKRDKTLSQASVDSSIQIGNIVISLDAIKGGFPMMKRQGDLLIVKVTNIPDKAVKKEHRILAEGEATGHMHELDSGELYEVNGVMFFRVSEGARVVLKHPEHHHLTFEPGDYKVIRQREYDPRNWRYVED